jgi:EAL domain-containing protein (putative c-di-GMP-specific phosphodiesterase class I)
MILVRILNILYSLIEHYRQAGCMIAVDDFGEGFQQFGENSAFETGFF